MYSATISHGTLIANTVNFDVAKWFFFSQNKEDNATLYNNKAVVTIPIKQRADLHIGG